MVAKALGFSDLIAICFCGGVEMVLWFFCLVFISGGVFAESFREIQSATTKILCGGSEITVVTTCSAEMLGGFPSCQEQDFLFHSKGVSFKVKAAGFLIKPKKSEPRLLDYIASDLACQVNPMSSDENYIVVRYYNGGNCLECELYVVYDLQGNVLMDRDGRSFNAGYANMRLRRLGEMQKIRIPFDKD
jgi:hypothetical protein